MILSEKEKEIQQQEYYNNNQQNKYLNNSNNYSQPPPIPPPSPTTVTTVSPLSLTSSLPLPPSPPPPSSDLPPKYDCEKGDGQKIRADFEEAIELTGYGRFHYLLLAICGLVSTSEEMDVISMSFILPSAQCDLNLNTYTKGWLNSIIFIGMMVGAYFWGSIADSLGRKKILIVISFMNAICIVASSFSQNYEWFMLFRFLNGAA